MILAALLLAAARPADTLTLDADDPVVVAEVAGQRLRLRVDLDGRDAVELNPDAARRLPLTWSAGYPAQVGPVELSGRTAHVRGQIGGRPVPLTLIEHGRACCAGVDGAITPALLPYAAVRFVRQAPAGTAITVPLRQDEDGLTVADGALRVQLSLARAETVASKAAGVLLAEAHGGRWAGSYAMIDGPFGVPRPVRPLALATPAAILGFRVDRILVRSDYGGGATMPEERPAPGDIVVSARTAGRRWALVTLGRDRLGRCAAITWRADPPGLELDCDAAPPARP